MCKCPPMLADGTMIGCRYCSQCVGRAVDDWTGRCIAESIKAVSPFFVSLTYGRDESGSEDHIRARLLTYSDVQKYMKKLRASGYCPRYFCVGEYGSAKGRAHWHVLIFWKDNAHVIAQREQHNDLVKAKRKRGQVLRIPEGPVPPHKPSYRCDMPGHKPRCACKQKRFEEPHWDHGFSTWEPLGRSPEETAAAVRYVCKYLNKDIGGEEKQTICRMSKVPLLGADWLHHKAALHVEAGIPPVDLFYEFPGVNRSNGERVPFMLRPGSAAAKLFCQSFVDQWAEAYGQRPVPHSKLIEEFISPGAWEKRAPTQQGQWEWERKAEHLAERNAWGSAVVTIGPLRSATIAQGENCQASSPPPLPPPKPIADTPPLWGGLE